jgi:hypothetical protein
MPQTTPPGFVQKVRATKTSKARPPKSAESRRQSDFFFAMKNFKSIAAALLMLCAAGTTLFLASCQKDSAGLAPNTDAVEVAGKFSKELTVKDEAQTSWMKIRVSADDAALLDYMPTFSLKTQLGPIEPLTDADAAAPAAALENTSNLLHIEVLEQYQAAGAEEMYLAVAPPTAGAQERLTGISITSASNCGFGWKVTRTSGARFTVAHYKGDACAYPNTHVGTWLNRNFYSTGYFWGMRHRVIVSSSGHYVISHGQFQPGNW